MIYEISSAPTKYIAANTIITSNSMNKKAINAMAIRSPQVELKRFAGGTDGSFEEIKALKSASSSTDSMCDNRCTDGVPMRPQTQRSQTTGLRDRNTRAAATINPATYAGSGEGKRNANGRRTGKGRTARGKDLQATHR